MFNAKIHAEKRKLYKWGTYGKNPDLTDTGTLYRTYQVVTISQLSTFHIYAILRTERWHLSHYIPLLKDELKYRALNGIYIPDTDRYENPEFEMR